MYLYDLMLEHKTNLLIQFCNLGGKKKILVLLVCRIVKPYTVKP
jgi:hypothetical protein